MCSYSGYRTCTLHWLQSSFNGGIISSSTNLIKRTQPTCGPATAKEILFIMLIGVFAGPSIQVSLSHSIVNMQIIKMFLLFLQSFSKGDTVEVLKKQIQEKDSQISEGMWSQSTATTSRVAGPSVNRALWHMKYHLKLNSNSHDLSYRCCVNIVLWLYAWDKAVTLKISCGSYKEKASMNLPLQIIQTFCFTESEMGNDKRSWSWDINLTQICLKKSLRAK